MGTYLEQIFPFLGVRFISISDRYDSKDYKGKSSDIEVQFKGLIADFYVKDQSVKVKAAVNTRRGKKVSIVVVLHLMGIESIQKIRKNW